MIDLTAMIINLSNSLYPVQQMVSGLGYIIGIGLMINGFLELKKHAESGHGQGNHEDAMSAIAYIFGGAMLVYMNTTVSLLTNTVFGMDNVLSYSPPATPNLYHAFLVLIQTAGVVWFVRGMVLVVQSTKPGYKEGGKGMTFLFAGICAINFEGSVQVMDYIIQQFFTMMAAFRTNFGLTRS